MTAEKKINKNHKDKSRHNFARKKSTRDDAIGKITKHYESINSKEIKTFADLPLSKQTLNGLRKGKYYEPTEIQREAIGLALNGTDLLGAAMTGSGKTLAFVVPVLECLWRQRWTQFDGLGALIVSPTRELAIQTYDVLRQVGCNHDFSAALIIGGTDFTFEKERICRTNIVVCTPGRILQHMDENPMFSCDNLQILVLDEADRILDMGFEKQINAMVQNLPSTRQTLLFSATQTKSIKDLARLSLNNPMYVSVHEHAEYSTPSQLKQSYVVCDDEDKLNFLWSFIKNHLQAKILVFFTNCKQVRFVYESFRHLRPGMPVLALHGSMNQMKRVDVYQEFCNKQRSVLFATDVAARGLDFPDVQWVLQIDCPVDSIEYIHRSGRTARFRNEGQALLVLTPSQEKAMTLELERKKIPITRINVNRDRLLNIQKKLEVLCAKDPTLKTYGQRAFVAYVRSIFVMSNKEIFDVKSINHEALATSFGLVGAPRVRFLRKLQPRAKDGDVEVEDDGAVPSTSRDVFTKFRSKQNIPVYGDGDTESAKSAPIKFEAGSDDDVGVEDLLVVKNSDVFNVLDEKIETELDKISADAIRVPKRKPLSKATVAQKLLKKKIQVNKKVIFDDESLPQSANKIKIYESNDDDGVRFDIEEAKRRMAEEDKIDREVFRQKIRAKHREERRKAKLAEAEKRGLSIKKYDNEDDDDEDGDVEVVLGNPDEVEGDDDDASVEISRPSKRTVDHEDDSESDSDAPQTKKRRKFTKPKDRKLQRALKNLPSAVSLDEEFALHLLENS